MISKNDLVELLQDLAERSHIVSVALYKHRPEGKEHEELSGAGLMMLEWADNIREEK